MTIWALNQNCHADHEVMEDVEYSEHLQNAHGYCGHMAEMLGRDLYCMENLNHTGIHCYNTTGIPVSSMGTVFEGYEFR